ncbi:MAG TPA: hypothetical protein VGO48_08140 [Conexibacter sp.]|nr:hypothetical protein [Conexibacter sp.]
MIAHVGKEVDDHADTIGRLSNTFTAMLWGTLVWRRWRDLLLGWEPYKPRPLPWDEER